MPFYLQYLSTALSSTLQSLSAFVGSVLSQSYVILQTMPLLSTVIVIGIFAVVYIATTAFFDSKTKDFKPAPPTAPKRPNDILKEYSSADKTMNKHEGNQPSKEILEQFHERAVEKANSRANSPRKGGSEA